jgi:predicted nucleic acid-binding protein
MTDIKNGDKICFIDSNIWLYAFIETPDKSLIAKSLIEGADITISTQVINEVCVNLIKKSQFPEEKIRNLIESFYNKYSVLELGIEILFKASNIRTHHNFSFWDSLILASALHGGCDILYSEDMQAGFMMESTIIINPFK